MIGNPRYDIFEYSIDEEGEFTSTKFCFYDIWDYYDLMPTKKTS